MTIINLLFNFLHYRLYFSSLKLVVTLFLISCVLWMRSISAEMLIR